MTSSEVGIRPVEVSVRVCGSPASGYRDDGPSIRCLERTGGGLSSDRGRTVIDANAPGPGGRAKQGQLRQTADPLYCG